MKENPFGQPNCRSWEFGLAFENFQELIAISVVANSSDTSASSWDFMLSLVAGFSLDAESTLA
jgi:hypothetical protein